ncbi:MAG: diadenylate cyclase [Pseudomonadota bacterium]
MSIFFGLGWRDVIDILFNSYILFRLYVLFRGTNVVRVLGVMGVLWFLKQGAVSLGLIITSWAIQGIIAAAALIIIIIFRNEISSILQTRTLKSFFWGIPRHQLNTPLNIIVDSVYEMARKKIGGLIVLPLKHGLTTVVQGGIPWQGKLSQEMLVSVFWPDNPVHDGAVIIQGNQITDVSVILPLSKREDLPSHFGTRHRAAMGLAEQTDALVLVVSEERGKISLLKESRIYDINDRRVLEKLLLEHAGDDGSRGYFNREVLELAVVGVISLVCITGLWFGFSKGMETLATVDVPVEFMNPDQKMEIFSASAGSVKLVISGSRPLINATSTDQIKIKLDLTKVVPGTNRLTISRENILLPPGIQLKQITPSVLDVTVDLPVQKQVPVQPVWTGRLGPGLVMTEAVAAPPVVKIVGGSLIMKDMSTVFTEPIPLDSLKESGELTVGLDLGTSNLKLESGKKNQVTIKYSLSRR